MKRPRRKYPREKPRHMTVEWGCLDPYSSPSIVYTAGGEGAWKRHLYVLMDAFERKNSEGKSLTQELEEMGYDIKTLKFSICLKNEEKESVDG